MLLSALSMEAALSVLGKQPGTYALLTRVDTPISIAIGKLGVLSFDAGCYCYVGSALSGVQGRVARHLRPEKKVRWHVDYLLQHAQTVAVLCRYSRERLECRIAQELKNLGLASVRGFGASDCQCSSHLFHHPEFDRLRQAVEEAFR